MIDSMAIEDGADPNRMYASGFSFGGSLMWDLRCDLRDRLAAVGSVAANMWPWNHEACDTAAPTELIHILGTSDFRCAVTRSDPPPSSRAFHRILSDPNARRFA